MYGVGINKMAGTDWEYIRAEQNVPHANQPQAKVLCYKVTSL